MYLQDLIQTTICPNIHNMVTKEKVVVNCFFLIDTKRTHKRDIYISMAKDSSSGKRVMASLPCEELHTLRQRHLPNPTSSTCSEEGVKGLINYLLS